MKKRLPYITGFLFFTAVEFAIGIFCHDNWIRYYFGDVVVVWVVYLFIKSMIPDKINSYFLAGGVLAFSVLTEFLQKIHIVDILGIENRFLRILIGTSFAVEDIWCYIAGTAVTFLLIFIKNEYYSRKYE